MSRSMTRLWGQIASPDKLKMGTVLISMVLDITFGVEL